MNRTDDHSESTKDHPLLQVASLLGWVYIYLAALLCVWVGFAMLTASWQPVVITSGSMQPSLKPGDVLLVSDHPDTLVAQRSVITFVPDESTGVEPGTFITHRVFSVESDSYVTKGDANPTPDTDRVDPAQVRGVGRLVVPLVGLPVLWVESGNLVALGAWIAVTVGAFVIAIMSARSYWRRPRKSVADRGSPAAETAVRRVRALIAVMILSQYLVDPSRFDIEGTSLARWQVILLSIGLLGLMNQVSLYSARRDDPALAARLSIMQLTGDTILVVMLTTATGTGGIGWVLFALPIIEAAARFRLTGALIHWMALTGVTIMSRIWTLEVMHPGTTLLLDELEKVLDQLSVLLLVVIPGAHLAEQLVADVLAQRRGTSEAIDRGKHLERVAETGKKLNRLGSELFSTMTAAVLELGFDHSDVCVQLSGGEWQIHAVAGPPGTASPIPAPGTLGSGLNPMALTLSEAAIDADDPEPAEWRALQAHGLAMVARIIVAHQNETTVALRAAVVEDNLDPGAIDALRLLGGQASVAMQNERLLEELRGVHVELEYQAHHDSLTSLPNRARFVERLTRHIDEPATPDRLTALLFIDLDGFKQINDRLGHDAGDALLQIVAQRLLGSAGETSVVARLGGDEFTVLVPEVADPDEAEALVAAVHRALVEPYRLGVDTVSIGASIGMAFSEAGVDGTELLRRADAAMYDAKARGGRPHSTTYHPDLDLADVERARLGRDLDKALDTNELQMAYQPIVEAVSQRIVGVEALVRWNHGELGWINPLTIIELAEANGRMDALNSWILRRTTIEASSWRSGAGDLPFLTVNVSPAELASPFLIDHVGDALALSGMAANRLVIELSERIVSPGEFFSENLSRLIAIGVQLALDDFGEGRTSLAHLQGLPIGMLKMDRSLVRHAGRSAADQIILESVCRLAHELSLTVVAEGVEDEAQLDAVRNAGADWVQGYHIHRPLTAQEVHDLLTRQLAPISEPKRGHKRAGGAV